MKTSTERILTTHVGSIPRPDGVRTLLRARLQGQPIDLQRVATVGHSAGGHLALWAAKRTDERADDRGPRLVRVAAAVAAALGTVVLTVMYFVLLAPFAWLARRAERRDPVGWAPIAAEGKNSPTSQY